MRFSVALLLQKTEAAPPSPGGERNYKTTTQIFHSIEEGDTQLEAQVACCKRSIDAGHSPADGWMVVSQSALRVKDDLGAVATQMEKMLADLQAALDLIEQKNTRIQELEQDLKDRDTRILGLYDQLRSDYPGRRIV